MTRVPALYLVADRGFLGSDRLWLERLADVALALSGLGSGEATTEGEGPVMLQLRVKDVGQTARLRLLSAGLERARAAGVPVLVNGTLAEARELGFDGAQWPENLIPSSASGRASAASRTAPGDRDLLVGASVHSADAARAAAAGGARFLVFGPVFPPGSKPGTGVGLAALGEIASASHLPVVAIGGVTAERAAACRAAGARGVAVVSAIFAPEVAVAAALTKLLVAVRDADDTACDPDQGTPDPTETTPGTGTPEPEPS